MDFFFWGVVKNKEYVKNKEKNSKTVNELKDCIYDAFRDSKFSDLYIQGGPTFGPPCIYRSENFVFSYDDRKSFQFIIYFQRVNILHSFVQIFKCSGKTVVLVLSQKIFLIIKKIKNCTYARILSKRSIKTTYCMIY